ncbi:KaiC protein [Neorhodopirellula lusitana]|uniref:KaiC protein n=1 Tax=Neorhodopirellula lusitana TaxID=445327 RepID=A0ABY1QB62_9BACT|nr:ATPase domain-containing protein [Neorhodopirellula lusitana]SMP65801.1 KaiC protein [Neorhodopirellula lusitana]
MNQRLKTGIEGLDELLGGGLLPGKLTVVLGATGIGKTQLGVSFADHGRQQEGQRGVVFDLTSRGDSQNHFEYAASQRDWEMAVYSAIGRVDPELIWDPVKARQDYLHLFEHSGRRVTAGDLDSDGWRQWKAEQTRKLDHTIAFLYGNFVHGVRRLVVDGVEPVERAAESIQFEMFEYVYHQVLMKEHDWVARDLFRVGYRDNEAQVTEHAYDRNDLGCLLLATSHEVMLDDLISRPIESGDVMSGANTIILMGKTRDGNRMGRALYVAKHRGSACEESIVPYQIDDSGIRLV